MCLLQLLWCTTYEGGKRSQGRGVVSACLKSQHAVKTGRVKSVFVVSPLFLSWHMALLHTNTKPMQLSSQEYKNVSSSEVIEQEKGILWALVTLLHFPSKAGGPVVTSRKWEHKKWKVTFLLQLVDTSEVQSGLWQFFSVVLLWNINP